MVVVCPVLILWSDVVEFELLIWGWLWLFVVLWSLPSWLAYVFMFLVSGSLSWVCYELLFTLCGVCVFCLCFVYFVVVVCVLDFFWIFSGSFVIWFL